MNIINKYKLILIYLIIIISSCSMEDFQDNPNYPSEGTPSLLLPRIIEQTFYDGNQVGPAAASQILFYTERAESDQYWGWSTSSLSNYETIKQAVLMENASDLIDHKCYKAIANLIKQINYYQLTRSVGDIPYEDSMKALEGNFSPKYDTQKSIFISIFQELENINNVLSDNKSESISGDILYNGDITKWQKLTNSYKLKMLMDLSMKENDKDIDIKKRFNDIFTNPNKYPIFENNQDMPRFKFFDLKDNRAPTFDRTTTKVQTKLTSTIVDFLKETKDPRIFTFAEPAWPDGFDRWTNEEKEEFRNDFDNYYGLNPGGLWGDEVKKKASNLHWRYHDNPVVEDYCKFTFAELNFILAEASARKWIQGDTKSLYKSGVEASMKFFEIGDDQIDIYWEDESVKLDVDNTLEQINMQRWIAYFMNSNWEAYYNIRRTKSHMLGNNFDGVPSLKISPNHYTSKMPMRWMYPQSEYNTNKNNVEMAVRDQFKKEEESQYDLIWMIQQ